MNKSARQRSLEKLGYALLKKGVTTSELVQDLIWTATMFAYIDSKKSRDPAALNKIISEFKKSIKMAKGLKKDLHRTDDLWTLVLERDPKLFTDLVSNIEKRRFRVVK